MKYRWAIHTLNRPEQRLPAEDWRTWLYLAGRGAGKTRAGAEAVRHWAESGAVHRIHLIAPTAADIRDTMIDGPSGILACCPPDNRPIYTPSTRRLTWPNGCMALLFSAEEPERLRGPQCEKLWADEAAAWRRPETWDMAMFGLRMGRNPQAIVTTTPKPIKLIKELLANPTTITTRGTTYDNRENLASQFLEQIITKYEGTRLGRQELLAEILDDNPNALWKRAWIEAARVAAAPVQLTSIVVGVDPAVSNTVDSDLIGIVVAGKDVRGEYYVLDDRTRRGTPHQWALEAVATYRRWQANTIIAEINNGGDMVEHTIHTEDKAVPVKKVHASRGKSVRAEPISMLYEQGHVHHVGFFPELEDQLCDWDPSSTNAKSPDRMDALVWALTELTKPSTDFQPGPFHAIGAW
jgi:phage terminase large subunit-like protein